jgi:hypothetical protein
MHNLSYRVKVFVAAHALLVALALMAASSR